MAGGVGALANTQVKTDSNGYLLVTIGGGTVTAMTITTLTTSKIQPPTDSTTAILIANAAGTGKFVYDTTNGRMAIGKATTPTQTLDVLEAQNGPTTALLTNTTSDTLASAVYRATAGSVSLNLYANSQGFTTVARQVQGHGLVDTPYLDLSSSGANPIDFWSNNIKMFSITTGGKVGMIAATACAGMGVPSIYAAGRVAATTGAAASISTYTVGAADGSFEVSANMNVTASTALTTTLTCTYTDEAGTARSMIFPVQSLAGTFIAAGAISGAGATVWETPVMHIRCKQTTAITILTSAGTFTGVTYTAEGIIKQTA